MDDFSLVETGTTRNLMANAGFESGSPKPGQFYVVDESYLDNTVLPALRNAEKHNVAVTIELAIQGFPDWVYQDYPETSMAENWGFLKADIENPRVHALLKEHVRILMTRLKDSPALQAVNLSNESEYFTNQSQDNRAHWQEYLRARYDSLAALNRAHRTAHGSFAAVPIPDIEKVQPNALYFDYLTYKTERLTAFHKMLADEVHKYDPTMPVHVKLMGWGVNNNDFMLRGGKSLEQMAAITNLTGIDGGPQYGSGAGAFAEYVGMLDMIASMRRQPTYNSENHMIADGEARYEPNVARWTSNWLWNGALHGNAMSAIWVWQRSNTTDYLIGSIINRPDAIAAVGRTTLDLNRLANEVATFQNEPATVGLLYSLTPRLYSPDYHAVLTRAYTALSYSGQKVGYVTENQIDQGGLAPYRLLVLPEVNNVSAASLAGIRKWEAGGGRVVLLGDPARLISKDERDQPLPASDRAAVLSSPNTTVMDATTTVQTIRGNLLPLIEKLGLATCMVYDAATDLPVFDVEWRTASREGRTLLSIVNYSDTVKTVYVRVAGRQVALQRELVGGTRVASPVLRIDEYGHALYVLP